MRGRRCRRRRSRVPRRVRNGARLTRRRRRIRGGMRPGRAGPASSGTFTSVAGRHHAGVAGAENRQELESGARAVGHVRPSREFKSIVKYYSEPRCRPGDVAEESLAGRIRRRALRKSQARATSENRPACTARREQQEPEFHHVVHQARDCRTACAEGTRVSGQRAAPAEQHLCSKAEGRTQSSRSAPRPARNRIAVSSSKRPISRSSSNLPLQQISRPD